MTQFIDITTDKKVETIFTHYLHSTEGWHSTCRKVENFHKVVYLGKCNYDGDLFACYDNNGFNSIRKGTKGSEF